MALFKHLDTFFFPQCARVYPLSCLETSVLRALKKQRMTFEQPSVMCFRWEGGEAEAKAEYSIHQTPVGFKGVFQTGV